MPEAIAVNSSTYPNVDNLLNALSQFWPESELGTRKTVAAFSEEELETADAVAAKINKLCSGDLSEFLRGYQFTCQMMMATEYRFRTKKNFTYDTSDEVLRDFYDSAEKMADYMNGLLLSQALWLQHIGPTNYFNRHFLNLLPENATLCEVGPGHGLYAAILANKRRDCRFVGIDISKVALEKTKTCLKRLGLDIESEFLLRDICQQDEQMPKVDAVVVSQVLEIVSDPLAAVGNLRAGLGDGGLLFLNCPVNMRAPDHIRHWQDANEIKAVLGSAFSILEERKFLQSKQRGLSGGYSYVIVAEAK